MERAHVVSNLHIDDRYRPDTLDLSEWSHLQHLNLMADVQLKTVSVLIGENVPQAHMVLENCYGEHPHKQPYAVRTPLGWCVAGPTGQGLTDSRVSANLLVVDTQPGVTSLTSPAMQHTSVSGNQCYQTLEKSVECFWNLEKHGFHNDDKKVMSVQDRRGMDLLQQTTKLVDGRYEIGMLWKDETTVLPNNRSVAQKRLSGLARRFKRNPDFAVKYKAAIDDYITKGYARRMTNAEASRVTTKTWYLPHHGVENPHKPKVRVVFDAAAEFEGTSLNEELIHGPDLNNNLCGVLLRFRIGEVGIAADIEAMFHQFRVPKTDQDALRFLWWGDGFENPPVTFQMTQHICGAADSPCVCIYGLHQCAEDNSSDFPQSVTQTVKRNFYVDDLLKAVPSEPEAVSLAISLIDLLSRGGLRLTKFLSNSKAVLRELPPSELAPKFINLDLQQLPIERALGMMWNVQQDTFGVMAANPDRECTRRGCLSVISSLYDPFGMVSPVVLVAKRILQISCQRKLAWDDQLPDDLMAPWKEWQADVVRLNSLHIPRCLIGSEKIASIELHHFTDASEVGYGTVSYVRVVTAHGEIKCRFVMAKSRTAPFPCVSIPRLELQAAVIGSRIDRLIRREMDFEIQQVVFWTDSRIVLQYIHNETRRFQTYVANRVSEIRDSSDPGQWRHVPGKINPADSASRGQTVSQFLKNGSWFDGPQFLQQAETEWPRENIGLVSDDDPELKEERIIGVLVSTSPLDQLLKRYSTCRTLQRAFAILMKFCAYIQTKSRG